MVQYHIGDCINLAGREGRITDYEKDFFKVVWNGEGGDYCWLDLKNFSECRIVGAEALSASTKLTPSQLAEKLEGCKDRDSFLRTHFLYWELVDAAHEKRIYSSSPSPMPGHSW